MEKGIKKKKRMQLLNDNIIGRLYIYIDYFKLICLFIFLYLHCIVLIIQFKFKFVFIYLFLLKIIFYVTVNINKVKEINDLYNILNFSVL
jgi:hypothetical protein